MRWLTDAEAIVCKEIEQVFFYLFNNLIFNL